MAMLDSLRKKLTPELMTQVEDALGDDFDDDMVPRSRLNKVIKQRNDLRGQLGFKTQIEATDEEEKEDKGEVKFKPENFVAKAEHDKLLNEMKTANATELKNLKVQYAALDKLRDSNAIDPDLVYRSVVDKTKLAFDDKGVLTGLDEQLTTILKDKAFLFNGAGEGTGRGTGKGSGSSGDEKDNALNGELDKIFNNYSTPTVESEKKG